MTTFHNNGRRTDQAPEVTSMPAASTPTQYLSDQQLADFNRDGFLVIPNLCSTAEIEMMRAETNRLCMIESDCIIRERSGGVRTIFRSHENDGPTQSRQIAALSRSARILGPVMQVLGDEDVYIYHSKINTKPAIEGTVWLWHQDYGYWMWDGVPTPNMVTMAVSLEEATEMNGALYIVPGSHRLGRQEHYADETTTSYKQWTLDKPCIKEILLASPAPVPVVGPPGTGVLFHCNVLHASGHNLSAQDRWQLYFAFNTVANKPNDVENPRGDHVRSTNYTPLRIADEAAVFQSS